MKKNNYIWLLTFICLFRGMVKAVLLKTNKITKE